MIIVGMDEVGRGPLAGPLLVAAAAFRVEKWGWDEEKDKPSEKCPMPYGIKDSKQYGDLKRELMYRKIKALPELAGIGYGAVSPEDIDRFGMAAALKHGFELALKRLPSDLAPDLLLVDGTSGVESWEGPQKFGPKGDARWWPVAAASILAKVTRDAWMVLLSQSYPMYGWASNKGYGARKHVAALHEHGVSPHHRRSFLKKILPQENTEPRNSPAGSVISPSTET
jgi:ribonuclease HII